MRCTSPKSIPTHHPNSPEEAVLAEGEAVATVVLEADPPVKRRGGVGTDPPVPSQLSTQRDPVVTPAALRVIPAIPIASLTGRPVLHLQPALVTCIVVLTVVTRPGCARHFTTRVHVAGSWYDSTYASAAITVSQTSTARPSVSNAVRMR